MPPKKDKGGGEETLTRIAIVSEDKCVQRLFGPGKGVASSRLHGRIKSPHVAGPLGTHDVQRGLNSSTARSAPWTPGKPVTRPTMLCMAPSQVQAQEVQAGVQEELPSRQDWCVGHPCHSGFTACLTGRQSNASATAGQRELRGIWPASQLLERPSSLLGCCTGDAAQPLPLRPAPPQNQPTSSPRQQLWPDAQLPCSLMASFTGSGLV